MKRASIAPHVSKLVSTLNRGRKQLAVKLGPTLGALPNQLVSKLGPATDRARIARLYVVQTLERMPLPRSDQPVLLLSISTLVIGVALVLVRSGNIPAAEPGVGYLAAAKVSLQAFELPPEPTAAPRVAAAPAPRPRITRVVFPTSKLSRSEGIRIVVATAHTLLGRPYRWGATGPGSFDCSGFTSFVWRAAGLSLPHSSYAQFGSLPRVSLSSLQPGDIVFSRWNGEGHVGLYIGGGRMINAPRAGRVVEIAPIRPHSVGAVRPALLLRDDQSQRAS